MEDIAFIRAIRENPEDDALRLVYADWLDERGDPRGEFLRLQHSLIGLRKKDPRIPEIEGQMEKLRSGFAVAWLACVDRTERFTMLWTSDYCDRIRQAKEVGKPLRFVYGGHNRNSRFPMKYSYGGHYLYPLRVDKGKLYVVARMRILQDQSRARRLLQSSPRFKRFLPHRHDTQMIVGEAGSAIRLDLRVPPEVLFRLRFQEEGWERGLDTCNTLLANGAHGLTRLCRLTAHSAQDFDSLIDGDYQPPPVSEDD